MMTLLLELTTIVALAVALKAMQPQTQTEPIAIPIRVKPNDL